MASHGSRFSQLLDAHLHLQDAILAAEIEGVLGRARRAGVTRFVTNGTSPADWPAVLVLARSHDGVIPCFGLHPWYAGDAHKSAGPSDASAASSGWLESLQGFLAEVPSAVGEIGLDRWRKGLDPGAQEEAFRAQLQLARRLRRPVMVHCVQAWDWLLEVLDGGPALPAGFLVHACGAPVERVGALAERGAYFSFAGDTLESRKTHKQAALRAVPLDRILIETDAPDMLPPPRHRTSSVRDREGRERNEPANLPAILRGLAEVRGVPEEDLAQAVGENARRFLGALWNVADVVAL